MITSTALVTGLLGAVALVAAPPAAQAADTFTCTGEIYAVSRFGELRKVNPTTGDLDDIGRFDVGSGERVNALALPSGGGNEIWAYNRTVGEVLKYDAATGATAAYAPPAGMITPTVTVVSGVGPVGDAVIAGAINPRTGIYYFAASQNQTSTSDWDLYAFNTAYAQDTDPATEPYLGQVGTFPDLRANGDLAFDTIGNLYLVSNATDNNGNNPGILARVVTPCR